MYQATQTDQTYVAEPSPRWRYFVKGLLWLNFATLVVNATLAVIFWLSGVGPAWVSLTVAFLSCLVIVVFTRFARRRVCLFVPWEEAEEIAAQCLRNLRL